MVVFSCRRQEVTFGVLSGQTLGCGVVFDQVGVFKGREGEVAIESKPVFKAHQVANSRQDAAFAEHFGARAAARVPVRRHLSHEESGTASPFAPEESDPRAKGLAVPLSS